MLYIGLQSLMFYATLSWVPPLYQSHGYTAQRAGLLLGAMSVVQIFASVGVPALADRGGGRRSWILLAVTVNIAGLAAVAAAPTAAPLIWMALLGFGAGAAFALGLVLVVDTAADVHAAGPLSGMAFLGGYLLAAIGPPLVGALHDATGGFSVPFTVLAVVGLAALACGLGAAPVTRRR
jgi:CP family cyanate transporter-like MFS transporter